VCAGASDFQGMAFEYRYGIYNPGQYGADVQAQWDAMVADGWQAHTAMPAYNEVYIFWQRELPGRKQSGQKQPAEDDKGSA
jgi:hypothetical protein